MSNDNAWPLAQQATDYTIRHVRAVLPDQVLPDAAIVVREGRIAAIEPSYRGTTADLDGSGALLLPGLVDVHTDALEKERMPRPGTALPWDFSLASFESKLVAAGITTVFHGAGFQHHTATGNDRSVELALQMCELIDAAPRHRVDHRILHRVDIRSAEGVDALARRLAQISEYGEPVLVSHEDHTPGQGQYADRTHMERYIVHADGKSADEARARVDQLVEEAQRTVGVRDEALRFLGDLARAGRIRLMGHDPDTVEVVDAMLHRGALASEFPTTMAAARRSRELGLQIVAGAPNVLRGGSHAGNVSAAELVSEGLVDALASDYLPTGLLAAVWVLVRQGACDLPAAVRLVTSGPAQVAGLTDRGALQVGMRADLVLVDDRFEWPRALTTLTSPKVPATVQGVTV